MSARDQEICQTETCREAVLDIMFDGSCPSEHHIEMLLDRVDRGRSNPDAVHKEGPR